MKHKRVLGRQMKDYTLKTIKKWNIWTCLREIWQIFVQTIWQETVGDFNTDTAQVEEMRKNWNFLSKCESRAANVSEKTAPYIIFTEEKKQLFLIEVCLLEVNNFKY